MFLVRYLNQRSILLAVPLALVFSIITVAVVGTRRLGAIGIQCPVHAITGLDCPGCGATRSVEQLTNGNLVAALNHNVLLLPSAGFLSYVYLKSCVHQIRGTRADRTARPRLIIATLGLIVAFGIVRNINGVPFLDAANG